MDYNLMFYVHRHLSAKKNDAITNGVLRYNKHYINRQFRCLFDE